MDVVLQAVSEADKPVLARLLELYRHDLSEFRPYELSAHGTFGYRYLDVYFLDDDRRADFVTVDGELAGFVMTRHLGSRTSTIGEFFIVRRWRRRGVGREVAHQLFARSPGHWLVSFDDGNAAGRAFWPQVCSAVAFGTVDTRAKPPDAWYPGVELRFVTR
jgi:predicted acetyltransferase